MQFHRRYMVLPRTMIKHFLLVDHSHVALQVHLPVNHWTPPTHRGQDGGEDFTRKSRRSPGERLHPHIAAKPGGKPSPAHRGEARGETTPANRGQEGGQDYARKSRRSPGGNHARKSRSRPTLVLTMGKSTPANRGEELHPQIAANCAEILNRRPADTR